MQPSQYLPQPEAMTKYLKSLLEDPFNKFCVDCTERESTYANITYGTFICLNCANLHLVDPLGMDKSYVKSIFEDLWDSYQINVVTIGGGNKPFWDYLKEYNYHERKDIAKKYGSSSSPVHYYKRRLAALV